MLTNCKVGQKSNLGWRIASYFKLSEEAFADALKASTVESPSPFWNLIPKGKKEVIERDVSLLKKVGKKQPVDSADLDTLLDSLSFDQDEIKKNYLKEKLFSGHQTSLSYPGIKKMPITGTTIQSSKGLSAEYVFITHFDQRYLPGKDGVTDQSICNVLVALTRARKKVWFISTTDDSSEFLSWIDKIRIKFE